MRLLYKVLKRVLISFGLLYTYNILMQSFNLPIPINIINIMTNVVLGIPGFVGLIMFYLINYR